MSRDAPARARLAAYALLVLAALCWAGNFIVGRYVRDALPPLTLNLARWSVAFLFLLPFTVRGLVAHRGTIVREWRSLALLGLSGVGLFNSLQYVALTHTSAINASLVYTTTPVLIVILSRVILGERVSAVQLLGVAVSLAGAITVVTRGDLATLFALDLNRGDAWMLAAVVCWAFYSVMLRRRPRELPPFVFFSVSMAFGLALLAPMWLFEIRAAPAIRIDPGSIACVLYVALIAGLLAYAAWIRGVAVLGANRAGLFTHLVAMFTAVLAIVLLGERFGWHHLVGFVLILAGIWLATRMGQRERDQS